jgi:nicotinate-nucleotide adenylyltransferase
MQTMAIFGGTFNPVHWGHLLMAETARDQFGLDRVIWVPTYQPPHKTEGVLDFQHRLHMVRLAIADQPAFLVSDVESKTESRQNKRSYAIATLDALRLLYPNSQWYWIMGMDTFQTLPRWYAIEHLAAQCTWLVARRRTRDRDSPEEEVVKQMIARSISFRWHVLPMPFMDISSGLIRQFFHSGRSIRYLVPDEIQLYITEHKLYK